MSRRPSPALVRALESVVSVDGVSTAEDDLRDYGRDWTRVHTPAPTAIVWPRSAGEVAEVVRLAAGEGAAIVPSGGRTGLAAGAVAANGELVVSLERMRRMGEIDLAGATVRVEAGAVTAGVHEHVRGAGLTWPVDFASKGSSQVGGNIATNAGGVRVIRYGTTRAWVLGLEVVLASGERVALSGALEKNNTGADLKQLFIGSEGTLGIVTGATLKLTKLPTHVDVMLFAVTDLHAVLGFFADARRGPFTIMAFECFSDRCLERVMRHRGVRAPLDARHPWYVLLEVEGASEGVLGGWIESIVERGLVLDGTMAQTGAQARALWELREGISESLSATGHPHKNDVSLPIAALGAFTDDLERAFAAQYGGWEICLFGHIGDGNLHVNVMKPDALGKDAFLARTHEADHALFSLVRKHHGSISAEHGIGLLKKDFLDYTRSPAELAMLRALKKTYDPQGVLNPGKIFDLE